MSGVKCINKIIKLIFILVIPLTLCGCGELKYSMPYSVDTDVSSYSVGVSKDALKATPFANDLCVVNGDILAGTEIESGEQSYAAAGLFDVDSHNAVYSRNIFSKLYPASMTKVMTALVAMEKGSKDDMLTATDNVYITESGATLCGFEAGDRMTLDQAMHAMLMYSGNDAAIVIAEGIGGSVENFCDMMNQEALRLGATNTHFVNPNGLHDENHYSTPYDMYLIFNEAIKYDWFNEIINMNSYVTAYTNANGDTVELEIETTNKYLKGDVSSPSNVTVIGGKTGTTQAAGANLVLLSRNTGGKPFVSVVMKADNSGVLYEKMNSLLVDIP